MLPVVLVWNQDQPDQLVLGSRSVESTEALGAILASLLHADDVLSLDGDLGAGKTALTRGIADGLQSQGYVSSPTFTLLMEHPPGERGLALYHFDVYRLGGADDFCEAGLDEYLDMGGVCVVEWGGLLAGVLPARTLGIRLYPVDPEQPDWRRIELSWPGDPVRLTRLANLLTQEQGGMTIADSGL
jgi:tRNA threonylcarbamoyladenosine biosynthesis protein TsaE